MAWGAEENGAPQENGNGLLGKGLEAVGLGGEGTAPDTVGSSNGGPPAKEKSPFDKAKTISTLGISAGMGVTLAGSYLYWLGAKRPKGRKKQPDGRVERLFGIAGISLGLSTVVVSGLVFGASKQVEKKVQESPILRALL